MTTKESRYQNKAPSRGGARPNAGRKKGSSPRYTIEDLMSTFEARAGVTFAEQVMENYVSALDRSDWTGVRDYDKILLAKLVADKSEIEVIESQDQVDAKQQAFQDALSKLVAKPDLAK
jgi:hypothetical protein